ncbi:potassium-transporting ATPase subunit B, partial [Streptomyces sp. NPDC002537]
MTTDTKKHENAMSTTTPTRTPHQDTPTGHKPENERVSGGLFDPAQLLKSLPDAFKKLDPRVMVKSPVMFVVEVGSVVTTGLALKNPGDWFG